MDIDLAQGTRPFDPVLLYAESPLLEYLKRKKFSTPLICPKRIEPGADNLPRPADSPYDPLFSEIEGYRWAHARFTTGHDGVVRWSEEWVEVCAAGRALRLPSVALQIANLTHDSKSRPRQGSLAERELQVSCGSPDSSQATQRRLLIGPRLMGERRVTARGDAMSIPANMLLDPKMAHDGHQLFAGRVVFIGTSHVAAGDVWLTPAGAFPGVELLANTVRFWPLQGMAVGPVAQAGLRAGAILLFAMFAFFDWYLRPVIAIVATAAGVLALISIAISLFHDYRVFELAEAAILLAIVYKALRTILDFIAGVAAQRRDFPRGWRGLLMTLKNACVRAHPGGKRM
jgi:CHASE2 domain-containing sensor protein